MASMVLGAIGGYFFGPLGFLIGSALGDMLFPQKQEGPRLTDLHTTSSAYGEMIPRIWGKYRIPLKVIWADQLQEHRHSDGGKGGPRLASHPAGIRRAPQGPMKGGPSVTTYTYTCSFYGHLCEGPCVTFKKIWIDKQLIVDVDQADSAELPITFFKGTMTQGVFSAAESVLGAGNVPAYRGKCGMGFDTLELADYGNRIPNIEVEVVQKGGDIPWRVSTFDTRQGSAGGVQWNGAAVLSDGVVSSTNWHAFGGGTGSAEWDEWTTDIYGNPVGSPFNTIHITPVIPPGFNSGLVPTQPCLNAPIWSAYGPAGSRREGWFVKGVYTSDIFNVTTDLGEEAVKFSMVKGDFLYAVGAAVLQKFTLTDGEPSAAPIAYEVLPIFDPTHTSSYKFGDSNDPFIYVSYADGTIWKYDADLTLVDTINAGDGPPAFGGGSSWMVYDGQYVFNASDVTSATLYSLYVYAKEGATWVLVGKADQAHGGFSYVGAGLVVGGDGILSLLPPEGGITLGEIVADISDICSVQSYDVTRLTDLVVGYAISTQGSGVAAISTLQNAWPFDAVESFDSSFLPVMKFVRRGQASIITIDNDDLAAHVAGQESPPVLEITRKLESELPRTVSTKYANVGADYQEGSQYERRLVTEAKSDVTIEMAIAMTDDYGKTVAIVYLFGSWFARTSFKFTTSVQYAWLEPTDVITIGLYTMRITKKTERVSGVIEWEALADDPVLWARNSGAASGSGNTTPVISGSASSVMALLDIPIPGDGALPDGAGASWPGFYIAARPASAVARWSTNVYKSSDGGTTYNQIAGTSTPDAIGTCSTVLGDFTDGNIFDEGNSITVVMADGSATLASVTRDEALAGANRAMVGPHEMVNFCNAVLTAPDTYLISSFLRGRRGTEWAIPVHGTDEQFVVVPPSMSPTALNSELGRPLKYKAVSRGQRVSAVAAVDFTNKGVALKCYAPVLLGGGPNLSNGIEIHWVRRTRIGGAWRGGSNAPISETDERYVVQIWDATYTVCARIIETTTPAATYTSAQQVTDFGADQMEVYATVGQVGSYGLGSQARVVLPGAGATIDDVIAPITPYNASPHEPPPEGGGGGGTLPVNHTFNIAGDSVHVTLTAGQKWVGKFTTPVGTPTGRITVSEYGGAPAQRHSWLASDSGGLLKIAGSDSYGTSPSSYVTGAGLTSSTDYYYLTDFQAADGSWLETPGSSHPSIIEYQP